MDTVEQEYEIYFKMLELTNYKIMNDPLKAIPWQYCYLLICPSYLANMLKSVAL